MGSMNIFNPLSDIPKCSTPLPPMLSKPKIINLTPFQISVFQLEPSGILV